MNKKIFTAILLFFAIFNSYIAFSANHESKFDEGNWNENVNDQTQIDLAMGRGYKVTGDQFKLASPDAQTNYVQGKNFDPVDENQRGILRGTVLSQDQLNPQTRKNLNSLLETEDFSKEESKSFFVDLAQKHVDTINANPDYFKKFSEKSESVVFKKFNGQIDYNKENSLFVLRGSENQVNFAFLKGKIDEGYSIEVGTDGEIKFIKEDQVRKKTQEIVLRGVTFKKHREGYFLDEFQTGRIAYSKDKPQIVMPDNCNDCSVAMGKNGEIFLKGSNFPLPSGATLQGFSNEVPFTEELKDFLQENKESLEGKKITWSIKDDKITMQRNFGEAKIVDENLFFIPSSSIRTNDGTFKISPIIKSGYGTLLHDERPVAFFNDNLDHSAETGSYIQLSSESSIARIVPRYNQHVIADLKVDAGGNPAHRFRVIDINSLGGKAEIVEGNTVVIAENGGLKSRHLPKTYVITATGYFASKEGMGKCTTTCYEIVKTAGIDRDPSLVISIRKLNELYESINSQEIRRKLDVSDLDFSTSAEYLISLYSREGSEKALDAIVSFGEQSLPTLDKLAFTLGRFDSVQVIERIYQLKTPSSGEIIVGYLKDRNLMIPTSIALGKNKDPRAIDIYKKFIEGKEEIYGFEMQKVAVNLLAYETDEANNLIESALKNQKKEVKYGTAIALAEREDERSLSALFERIKDGKEEPSEREQAAKLITKFRLRQVRTFIQNTFDSNDEKSKEILAVGLIPTLLEGRIIESGPDKLDEKEITELFYSSLNEKTREKVTDTLGNVLEQRQFEFSERRKAQDIASFLVSLDNNEAKSAVERALKSENKQTRYATALGIVKAGFYEEYPGSISIFKEIALDPETRRPEKIDAIGLIRFHQDQDVAKNELRDIYSKSSDSSIKAETATRLARLGDFSIMGDLLELIENPEEKGFKKAEIIAVTVAETETPRDKFLGALQVLFQINPDEARRTLESTAYRNDFVDALRKLSKDYEYVFDRNDYNSILELSRKKELFDIIDQRKKHLEGGSFSLKDAAVLLGVPEDMLAKPKEELKKELDETFAGKKMVKRTDDNGGWYREDWQNARDKLTKLEIAKVAVMEKSWREGNFKIVYDSSNSDHPELRGKELTLKELVNLDLSEKKTEIGMRVEFINQKVVFRIFDPLDKSSNGAHIMKNQVANSNGLSSVGNAHLHATRKLEPNVAGPSCGAGGGGDCGASHARRSDEFILTPTKDGVNLDYLNPRITVVDLGVRKVE